VSVVRKNEYNVSSHVALQCGPSKTIRMSETTAIQPSSGLVLGWRVNESLDPDYWLVPGAKPGVQPEDALVKVSAEAVGCHTAIIAQSGSGKSFFLGRLIEELLLQTKCRCLVFDPNSDFRKIMEAKDETLWKDASYDRTKRRGWLPHESDRAGFENAWAKVPKLIRTSSQSEESNQVKVWLPLVSADFLAEGLEPVLRADFYHCHAYVRALAPLVYFQNLVAEKRVDLLDEAETIFRKSKGVKRKALAELLYKKLDVEKLPKFDGPGEQWIYSEAIDQGIRLSESTNWLVPLFLFHSNEAAARSLQYVSEDGARFYFAKVREYQAAKVLLRGQQPQPYFVANPWRLEVIDLPSLRDRNARLLAVNAFLEQESVRAKYLWSQALDRQPHLDERVPSFIVVDEAHNLIPADPRNQAESSLREQFRAIAAEGRKFGMFLVLVSQRPDKLDPFILSECDNVAIMRLSSDSVLQKTKQLLRLEDVPPGTLQRVLKFNLGCGLLAGRWSAGKPLLFYSAARRTVEGGRDLRAEFWATKPE
jgi:DNA helicase HerA-like ATPase